MLDQTRLALHLRGVESSTTCSLRRDALARRAERPLNDGRRYGAGHDLVDRANRRSSAAVTTVRTVFTSIDEDEAIRRLDLLVRAFQEDRDTASTAATRHRVASFTDRPRVPATYDLAVGTGTTVAGDRATTITIEAEPISWRRIKLPVVGRWSSVLDGSRKT